ncbi:MAG: S9 family peptidase [Bacteroidales bacterium]|jgi:dipeptidyl aminopeptidase/acylaminoacyl peptidase|nr:S9 family peptidase [Bacteroidales bacterium]
MKHRVFFSRALLLLFVVFMAACTNSTSSDELLPDFSGELTAAEIDGGVMTPEILWKFGRVGEQKLSEDGKVVVYSVSRTDAKTQVSVSDLFTVSIAGTDLLKLTDGGSNFNARWKPGTEMIGYLSSASGEVQLWEMDMNGQGKVQVSDIEGGINGFEYSPDGMKIFYLKEVKYKASLQETYPDLPKANVRITEELMYRHWNHWEDEYVSHIFVADLNANGLQNSIDILEGEPYEAPISPYFDQAEITWNSDGTGIAYSCKKMSRTEYATSTNSDIYFYNLKSGATKNLTEGMPGYDKYPSLSPDGKLMAWRSMERAGFEADKDRLMLMELATGEITYLTEAIDQNVANLVWSDDSRTIWFITGHHATYQIANLSLDSLVLNTLTDGIHDYTSFEMANGVISATQMSMRMATEVFKVDPQSGEAKQISFVNKNIYDHIEMGEVRSRWVTTTDGKQMLVWVIYPPRFDETKEYPAILYCQGGPQSAVSQFFSFRWNFQMMASGGYVVVAPNRRGLPTFGQEWNDQISNDYGGQNMKDYLVAIDTVSAEPYVDADRLGAVGASYGGYSVYYLAGIHEGRFKAFISHCGIYNVESMYTETEEVFFVNHDNGGAYWDTPKPKNYAYSPHLKVANWDTPIMIISGEFDFRIPYTQSMQAFNAAQLLGIPSKLLIFPEESHFVTKPQNSILWQREFRGWLDEWLK